MIKAHFALMSFAVTMALFSFSFKQASRVEPPLIKQAVPITSVLGWPRRYPRYCWLSSSELLYFQNDEDGEHPDYLTVMRLNLNKHTIVKDRVTTLLSKEDIPKNGLTLSPNRNRFAWIEYRESITNINLSNMTRNNVYVVTADRLLWFPDNVHCLVLGAIVDDKYNRGIIVHFGTGKIKQVPFRPDGWRIHYASHLAMSPRSTLFVVEPPFTADRPPITTIKVTEVEINEQAKPLHHYEISLPSGVELSYLTFSPDCKRIAWECYSQGNPVRYELWVSNTDGSGMRLVGYHEKSDTKASGVRNNKSGWHPEDIEWLPDGKSLSFIYDNSLWRVNL